ncbi:MAG: hypothetical protein QXD63_01970 [Candidatus Pacearchaeota archaeon]
MLIKSKKADVEQIVKTVLWIVFFIILLFGLYSLISYLISS